MVKEGPLTKEQLNKASQLDTWNKTAGQREQQVEGLCLENALRSHGAWNWGWPSLPTASSAVGPHGQMSHSETGSSHMSNSP